jgi:hypothetical protein
VLISGIVIGAGGLLALELMVVAVLLGTHSTRPRPQSPQERYAANRPVQSAPPLREIAPPVREISREEFEAAIDELLEDDGPKATIIALDYWLARSSKAKHARAPRS